MQIFKTLALILVTCFGLFLIIYGGYDDSPGAQLLGLLVLGLGVCWLWRKAKKI